MAELDGAAVNGAKVPNKKLAGLVVALANKKGGVGKTTYSTNLAERIGATLVDVDPQGNAADWAEGCDHPHLRLGVEDVEREHMEALVEAVNKAKQDGPVVIDCPPGENGLFRVALGLADGVVIPFKPGAADMKAVVEMAKLIRNEVSQVNPGLKVMVLQNEARTQDSQGLTGLTVLSVRQLVPEAKFIGALGNRKMYAIAYSEHTVPKDTKAVEELNATFTSIAKTLGVKF
jgi:cellulose biosynthesis protein BcsQ